MFTAAWKFFRKYHDMPDNDESWQAAINESNEISKQYGCKLANSLLLASIDELERMKKEGRKSAEPQ
jgi:hypothetical protein